MSAALSVARNELHKPADEANDCGFLSYHSLVPVLTGDGILR